MESLKELFRIGYGPSSSHTMGPRAAMDRFCSRHPECVSYRAKLYGSLAATGKGHLTDKALREAAHKANKSVEILWFPDEFKPFHPNALTIIGLDGQGNEIAEKTYYSIGGGKIVTEDESDLSPLQSISILLTSAAHSQSCSHTATAKDCRYGKWFFRWKAMR